METPLRVENDEEDSGFRGHGRPCHVVDAEDRKILTFCKYCIGKDHDYIEAVVAAVNRAPALLEIAKEAMMVCHGDCPGVRQCGMKEDLSEYIEWLYQEGLKCSFAGCAKIAAAIRAAGGE